jgi:hypothetical protein
MTYSDEVFIKVRLQDPSYEVLVKGGDLEDIELMLNVVDKLRSEYGINVYLRAVEGGWLYGDLEDEFKVIVCGREINVNRSYFREKDEVEYLIGEILNSINPSGAVANESIIGVNEGPSRFSSAEYLVSLTD